MSKVFVLILEVVYQSTALMLNFFLVLSALDLRAREEWQLVPLPGEGERRTRGASRPLGLGCVSTKAELKRLSKLMTGSSPCSMSSCRVPIMLGAGARESLFYAGFDIAFGLSTHRGQLGYHEVV